MLSNLLARVTDADTAADLDNAPFYVMEFLDAQVMTDSLPDALATTAKFLLGLGYKPHLDWGFEVKVPKGFNYLLVDRTNLKPISFFMKHGVKRANGKPFHGTSTPVFLYAPAGATGPKFLMTANYLVLKGYNFSDSYALSEYARVLGKDVAL